MQRIVCLLSLFLLTACASTTGYHSKSQFSGHQVSNSRVKDVYVFYSGTPVPWEFEQLGLVTATGDQTASDKEVMAHFKMKALNIGADAIISVNSRTTPRNSGLVFGEKDPYNAISYQGTAIKFTDFDNLPDHIKVHTSHPDYQSKSIVDRESQNKSNSAVFEIFLSLAIGIAYLVSP